MILALYLLGITLGTAAVPMMPARATYAPQAESATVRRSFHLSVPVPPTPVPVEGTRMLVYELWLASDATEPLVLHSVEIIDAEDGERIARVHGEDLASRLSVPGQPFDDARARELDPGTQGVLYVEVPLREGRTPRVIEHRMAYGAPGEERPVRVTGARVAVRTEAPVVLAPPVRGGPWAAVYDPSWERGHRRVVYAVDGRARIPGRFAIDWILLDADGRFARGDADRIGNWYGYGTEVLAVADGVVVAVRDDVPESPTVSGHPDHPLEDATGNYVALDIGDGRYAFYEHLAPGSIRVGVGDPVWRGEVIGAIGFTGHTTGPHLHFHVADANSPLGAEGVPFVLERFHVLGRYEDFDTFGQAPWVPLKGAAGWPRRAERPASNVVVEFDAGSRWDESRRDADTTGKEGMSR